MIQSLREQIDSIDSRVAQLLGQRTKLVQQIGNAKGSQIPVRDLQREDEVIHRVRQLAGQNGFEPNVMEEIYRRLMEHFVELQKIQQQNN